MNTTSAIVTYIIVFCIVVPLSWSVTLPAILILAKSQKWLAISLLLLAMVASVYFWYGDFVVPAINMGDHSIILSFEKILSMVGSSVALYYAAPIVLRYIRRNQ